jgi:hypothetical protein
MYSAVCHPMPSVILELLVFPGEKVEQQAIVQPAIDVMTLTLSADETEAGTFDDPERWIALRYPRN